MYKFVSSHQRTPLHQAAAEGHVSTVRFLVEMGADINIKDDNEVKEGDHICYTGSELSLIPWLSTRPHKK